MATVEVLDTDITALEVDAIANAANTDLAHGGGVAGAISRAGGPDVQRESDAKAPIGLGEAVETTAGDMPSTWVIHAATMGLGGLTSEDIIRRATASTLARADELGAKSLALVAFGTGVGGFPLEDAARVEVEEVRAHLEGGSRLERVVFAVHGEAARAAFDAASAREPRGRARRRRRRLGARPGHRAAAGPARRHAAPRRAPARPEALGHARGPRDRRVRRRRRAAARRRPGRPRPCTPTPSALERAWPLVAAVVGALVGLVEPGAPTAPEALAVRRPTAPRGRRCSATPRPASSADARGARAAASRSRSRASTACGRRARRPRGRARRRRGLREPIGSHHPLMIAEAVARLGGRPADPASVEDHEDAVLAVVGAREGQTRAHDDPDPARRVARRILQRLDGMGKWGGYHTDFAHLARGFAGNDRQLASEVGEALLAAGLLAEKPSVGQRHVFLNPRAGDIRRLIETGESLED